MTRSDQDRSGTSGNDPLRVVADAITPAAQEALKTIVLLLLLMLSVWGLLEVFRAGTSTAPWHDRLWRTFVDAGLDKNGVPIAPRFFPAMRRSLTIVLTAVGLLAALSLGLGFLFAVRPALSVLRPLLGLVSAVPAFMFFYIDAWAFHLIQMTLAGPIPASLFYCLGVRGESVWFWPGACLALGDLNAAALVAHCYDGVRRELNQPYVRTALAQGLSVWSDVWPRALLITLEGVRSRIPHLLGGTVALEFAYNIHGLGQMALSAVLSSRPDYNVLVWIAGLGIVATRAVSLVHRLGRRLLTPERGRSTAWSEEGTLAGVLTLWRGANRAVPGQSQRLDDYEWLTPAAATVTVPSRSGRTVRRLRAYWNLSFINRLKMFCAACILALAIIVALIALWGGGYSMLETSAPMSGISRAHPLGTNDNGEDVLSTIALGGRELILPLIVGVGAAVLLGGFFGTLSGLWLGSVADVAMDLYAELWESVPKLVLVLAALTFISYTHYSLKLFLVMGLAFAPLVYRAVRDEVGALRTSLFLEAAVTLGVPRRRILWIHVLRNHALPVLCVEGAVLLGYLMLYDAILGYCQVRQRGEVFTWGNLLGTGLEDLTKRLDAGLDANSMIVWGPFVVMLVAIASSVVAGDALKSIGRSVRFSQ